MFDAFNFPRYLSQTKAPNRWDWALLPLILALIVLFAFAAMQMSRPFAVGETLQISLDPTYLPTIYCALFCACSRH